MAVSSSWPKSEPPPEFKANTQHDEPSALAPASPRPESTPTEKRKTVAQLFGEIVWLLTQSPRHHRFVLADLEWLVTTPMLLRQFRVFYASERPIGVALWAFVDDEVEQRLLSGRAKLAPDDWKSGKKLWLVEVVAPFGEADAMIKNLKRRTFPNREIAFLGVELGVPVPKTL
jgi:cytolysin-activating lysine-acyltransferase